jgi:hypothetical protein
MSTSDMNKVEDIVQTRFDLESRIMECWGVVEDIGHVREYLETGDTGRACRMLMGMQELYGVKFEKTFAVFERLLREMPRPKTGDLP